MTFALISKKEPNKAMFHVFFYIEGKLFLGNKCTFFLFLCGLKKSDKNKTK
jgi:hypothetical protein